MASNSSTGSTTPTFASRHALKALRRLFAGVLALFSLAACSPLPVLNGVARAGGGYRVLADVAYGAGARRMLDVYTPSAPAPAGGWPLAVFFYGGSWNSGQRADYAFVGIALAARGVVTVVADYRLYPEVRYPSFVEDSAAALAWGLEQAHLLGANPRRVFVVGHSAGAYNAAMLALDPRWLAATGHSPAELAGWVGLAGPYDFLPTDNPLAQPVFFHPNYPPHAQPIEFPSSDAPRSFLGAPRQDDLIDPVRSTESLAAKLKAYDVPVILKRYERAGHTTLIGAFAPVLRWIAPVLDDVAAFMVNGPAASAAARPARQRP